MIDVKIEMCACLNDGELYDEFKPFKAHESDAAYDIMAAVDDKVVLKPFETKVIPAGFKIELPIGYEAQIRGRSGNALKRKIQIANAPGTIDSGYRDEIGIIISNCSNFSDELNTYSIDEKGNKNGLYSIKFGDRIAQIVLCKYETIEFEQVEKGIVKTLGINRGGGFGHTGTR